jgi:peptidoglycan/xylan/chitin deacetylase (PgdA/CDA1 family)
MSYGKKAFAALYAALLLAGLMIGDASAGGSGLSGEKPVCVPILMYHEIKTYKTGKDIILPREFENDLKYLAENGYTAVTMEDLLAYTQNEADLPEKPIVLSFDDGYLSTYIYAFPLLKKYNDKIVLSIIGKNTDDFSRIPDDDLDYSHVTWDQLNEMLDSGCVEVQNHSYNLHKYGKRVGCAQLPGETCEAYEKLLAGDVGRLQTEIALKTGRVPTTFSYPYGKYGDATDQILRKLGFRSTLTCDYGVNLVTRDPECLFRLKRICRSHNHTAESLLEEAYKTIKQR